MRDARVSITDLERTLVADLMMPGQCGGDEVLAAFDRAMDGLHVGRTTDYSQQILALFTIGMSVSGKATHVSRRQVVMSHLSLTEKKHRHDAVVEALRGYFSDRPDVQHVLIFGSYVSNTLTERSDLDVVVVKNTDQRFIQRLTSNYLDLDEVVGVPVDILIYTPEEWERKKHSLFFQDMSMERII